jgi:voltage-gated sodium channel
MHKKIIHLVESSKFQNIIIALIVINGITMGLQTSKAFANNALLEIFDIFVITVFTVEIALRIYAHRVEFFKDGWSIFDFIIVAISLVPTGNGLEIFRILRVLRLFRLVTVVPQMKKIIMALISVVPGIISISALMMLFFYIAAIMSTQMFGEVFPHWFGTLGESFYTLFQVMTLESWSMGIVRPVMEVFPYAWVFFVPFIFLVTFIMVNLVIAVIVDAMSELNKDEEEHIIDEIHLSERHRQNELEVIYKELNDIKKLLETKTN